MNKFFKYFKKYVFIIFIIAIVILAANLSKKTSPLTLTRYRTSTSGTDSARVAKWEITAVSSKEGENIGIDSSFRNSITEGDGNWAFQFTNKSEVDAFLAGSTKIRIRLDNDNFNSTSSDTIGWNFISDSTGTTENPISFNLYVFNNSLNEVIQYKNIDPSSSEILSYDEFNEKAASEKANYKQVLKVTPSTNNTILNLKSDNALISFKKDNETINSKIIYFYYYDVQLSEVFNTINFDESFSLNMPGSTGNHYVTFVIDWNVKSNTSGGTTSGNIEKTYHGHKVSTDIPKDFTSKKTFNFNGVTYYYCESNELDFYGYTNYVNGLIGNEPTFEFKLASSIETMKIKYSQLTSEQKGVIDGYKSITIENITTLSDLKHYCEYQEYTEYKKYLEDLKEQQAALGYLTYGLKVNLKFNVHISQKEPK